MKIKVPEYFKDFKCIADKCKDSCCIGWEIAIDEKSRDKYSRLDGEIGEEIVNKTQHGCFPLEENGRCAFLDANGLCRIISVLGDGYLCDICREHPRYYGVGKDGIEGGLGLSCEVAARIILKLKKIPKIIEIERDVRYEDCDPFAEVSEYFRKELSESVFTLRAEEIISKYKAYATVADDVAFEASATQTAVAIPKASYIIVENDEVGKLYREFISLLEECEYMSDEWPKLLSLAKEVSIKDVIDGMDSFKGLLYYFTHRYVREGVQDMSLGQKILFSALSALTVCGIARVIDKEENEIRAAVLYSKNIEYSTDNVDMILDRLSVFL